MKYWLGRREDGQVIPVVVLWMIVILGFMGLVIDVGFALVQKRRLQSAVDMALISGAQSLPDATTAASQADHYLNDNLSSEGKWNLTSSSTASCMTAGCHNPDKLTLTANEHVPTFFLKLFGYDSFPITAKGAACGPCDSHNAKFDVVVVLDRSYSMCLDSHNHNNNCQDLTNAKEGIRSLVNFFNPELDQLSLELLGPGDNKSPYDHSSTGSNRITNSSSPYPCDTANPSDANVSGKGRFYHTVGDVMDGTAASHDAWVVAPLASDFKNADGTINDSSAFMSDLACAKHKYWTPIAPAIEQARLEIEARGRADANHVIIYFGDGAATMQPMQRDSNGNAKSTYSYYTPTAGNNNKPCHDAIAQANIAKSEGIEVYTIGYDLNSGSAQDCTNNSGSAEAGIDASDVMTGMATDDNHFFEQATAGDVVNIFNQIGHSITTGGTRLVE